MARVCTVSSPAAETAASAVDGRGSMLFLEAELDAEGSAVVEDFAAVIDV
jgi:hypothetical protein